tara:strand:+ start:554 stop:754 length:201 start_codon:yes stop_codon:yes gene_type:complete
MKARKKQVIMDFLHDDMKKLDYHVSKIVDNLYVEHQRYHNENFKQNVKEVERLISYWRTTTKNLNK